jgi:hypothetical protein
MSAAIEWSLILEVIWVSLVAGVGVTLLFSLVVFGSSRAAEARRTGSSPLVYGLLATVTLAAFLLAVAAGIGVILNK